MLCCICELRAGAQRMHCLSRIMPIGVIGGVSSSESQSLGISLQRLEEPVFETAVFGSHSCNFSSMFHILFGLSTGQPLHLRCSPCPTTLLNASHSIGMYDHMYCYRSSAAFFIFLPEAGQGGNRLSGGLIHLIMAIKVACWKDYPAASSKAPIRPVILSISIDYKTMGCE